MDSQNFKDILPVEGTAVMQRFGLVLVFHVKFPTVSARSSIIPDIIGILSIIDVLFTSEFELD